MILANLSLARHTGTAASALVSELGDVYADARAEPPYIGGELWSRDAFVARTTKQAADPGFLVVTGRVETVLVGFAFGLPFAAGQWFKHDTTPPKPILDAPKFAVIELNVRQAWRNRGIGRVLLDALLDRRPEPYAILSNLPDTAARQMYERWGWRKVSQTISESGLPPWDTLALDLADRH